MIDFLHNFEQKLALINPESDDFELQMDELIKSLQNISKDNQEKVMPVIFRFFEKYPLNLIGLPGTFTHFIEDFWPNYSDILLASLVHKPSVASVLMVNRILNSKLSTAERKKYMQAMQSAADSNSIALELRERAQDYLTYQLQK